MHVRIVYPDADSELRILQLAREEARAEPASAGAGSLARVTPQDVLRARRAVLDVHMSEKLEQYVLQLVLASREPERYGADLARWLQYGASPRGTIAIDRCARARAWLRGRNFVNPDDVQAVAPDVLRHRLILSYEAEADGIDAERVVATLLSLVAVP